MGQFLGVIYNEFNYLHHLTHHYLLRYHDRLAERAQHNGTRIHYSKDEYVRFENRFFSQIFEEFFAQKGHNLKYDPIRHHGLKEEVLYTVVHYPIELLSHMGHSKLFNESLNNAPAHTLKNFKSVRPFLAEVV